jgi:hypothetical protein
VLISISEGGPGCGAAPRDRADGFTADRGSQQAIRLLPGKAVAVVPLAPAAVPRISPPALMRLFACRVPLPPCLSWTGRCGIVGGLGRSASALRPVLHGSVSGAPEERTAFYVPGVCDRARNGRAS